MKRKRKKLTDPDTSVSIRIGPKDRLARSVANALPRRVVSWAIIRAAAKAWPNSRHIKKLSVVELMREWNKG